MVKEDEKFKEPSEREFTKLNLEYQECVSASRFLVGTRFNYFASFTTFFIVLIGGFYYVWITEEAKLGYLKPWFLLAISMFGLYTVSTVLILEKRVIQLYRSADNRAADLERLMGIKDGIRQTFVTPKLQSKFLGIPMTHTAGIGLFYKVIFVIWLVVVIFSTYQILDSLIH